MKNFPKFVILGLMYFTIGRPQDIILFLKYLHLGDILGGLTIVCLLFFQDKIEWPESFKNKEGTLLALLIIWMVVCSPFSIHLGHSLNFFQELTKGIILYLGLMLFFSSEKDFKYFARIMLFSAATLSLTSLMAGVSESRVSVGTMYDPNDLSMVLIACFPFIFWLVSNEKIIFKVFSVITVVASCIRIVSAQSRMGFLALILLGLLFTFLQVSAKTTIIKRIITVGAISLLLMTFGTGVYWDRMQSIFSESLTGSGRTVIWKRALKMVSEKPIFGFGPGAFSSAYGRKLSGGEFELVGDSHVDHGWKTAHNTYILVMTESGLPGFFLYCALILSTLVHLEKIRRRYKTNDNSFHPVQHMASTMEFSFLTFLFCSFFISAIKSPILFTLLAGGILIRKIAYKEALSIEDEAQTYVEKKTEQVIQARLLS